MSTHRVEVVRVGKVEPHPNADRLGLVRVWGYTAIVRLGDFKEGDLAAYVEPDYVVPKDERFAFVGENRRIRARRLRGVWSQGLLIPAPEGAAEGDDVMAELGVERYEPPAHLATGGDAEAPHPSLAGLHKYDIESFRRYPHVLELAEDVIVTEKIHGANARYAWRDGRMWCGSRTQWKRQDDRCVWWRALQATPEIERWCRERPDAVLYGEVYGQVQDLKYGVGKGEVRFAAFDALRGDQWAPMSSLVADGVPTVPLVYAGQLPSVERLEEMSRADSRVVGAKHCAEGIVIKPATERTHPDLGRVALKIVSDRYLERAK